MPIALWKDEFNTGNLQVDEEHKMLFGLVNTLQDAIDQQASASTLEGILHELANHTVQHFQTEETLMQHHRYPGFDRHKRRHDDLTTKVVKLIQRFEARDTSVLADLPQFLTDWLGHHIKGEDQKMIDFFRATLRSESQLMAIQDF